MWEVNYNVAAEKLGLQTRGEDTGNAVSLAPQILQGTSVKPMKNVFL